MWLNESEEILLRSIITDVLQKLDDSINGTKFVYDRNKGPIGVFEGQYYKHCERMRKDLSKELPIWRTLLEKLSKETGILFEDEFETLSSIEENSKLKLARDPGERYKVKKK